MDVPRDLPECEYLSKACEHAARDCHIGAVKINQLHVYCQSFTGIAGAKKPAVCKFCGSKCKCPCHTDTPVELVTPQQK